MYPVLENITDNNQSELHWGEQTADILIEHFLAHVENPLSG